MLHGAVTALLLVAGAYLFGADRTGSLPVFLLGPWRVPKAAFDALGMTFFLGGVVVLQGIAFASAWADLPLAPVFGRSFLAPRICWPTPT